jgi:hypothetical protein
MLAGGGLEWVFGNRKMPRWAVSAKIRKSGQLVNVGVIEAETKEQAEIIFRRCDFCFPEAIFEVLIVPAIESQKQPEA